MALNRSQARQVANLEQQCTDLKTAGNDWLAESKAAQAAGEGARAAELKALANSARDDWEQMKDEVEDRKENPGKHWWN
jgi:phage host-nuclease inhibitor protein Gam